MLKLDLILLILTTHLTLSNCAAQFLLFTRKNPKNEFLVSSKNINSSSFIRSAKTYFVVHGFTSNGKVDWALQIVKNLLQIENSNVISIDWKDDASDFNHKNISNKARIIGSKLSDLISNTFISRLTDNCNDKSIFCAYRNVAAKARTIGNELSEFINAASINRSTIHCIGHSLGAHICGFAGKYGKLARISGLDPAGPLFKDASSRDRLDKDDAYLVDNIHGDSLLGIQENIGHKDFYPNGGSSQKGCFTIGRRKRQDLVSFLSCSHNRIPYLFAESIISSCSFRSVKCQSYSKSYVYLFKKFRCD